MRLHLLLPLCAACGTYSMVRPANTLPKGKTELAAGLAASQIGEVNTILHAAYGFTDDVEVLAQNEIWNSFIEARYGFLHNDEEHPVALAAGVGGGYAVTLISAIDESGDGDQVDGAAGTVSVAAGHRFGKNAELTLMHRSVVFAAGYLAASTRLGLRLNATENFGFMLEAGGTAHTAVWADGATIGIAEGSAGLFVGF